MKVVFGVNCTWWDTINRAGRLPSGLPCCPICSSVLMEVESLEAWEAAVKKHAIETNDPGYTDMVLWMRGKCFPTYWIARGEYTKAKEHRHG